MTKTERKPISGAQLQELIDKAKLTQVGLAAVLGIGSRHVRRYIADESPIPWYVEIAARCLAGQCRNSHVVDDWPPHARIVVECLTSHKKGSAKRKRT